MGNQVICARCGKDISDKLGQYDQLLEPVCWTCRMHNERVTCLRCGEDISDKLDQYGQLLEPVCWACWQHMEAEREYAAEIAALEERIVDYEWDLSSLRSEREDPIDAGDIAAIDARIARLEDHLGQLQDAHDDLVIRPPAPVSPNQMRLWA
jgi:DNA-directed RNA polymerase subunit N (RpoN/RPB10)